MCKQQIGKRARENSTKQIDKRIDATPCKLIIKRIINLCAKSIIIPLMLWWKGAAAATATAATQQRRINAAN